MSRALHLRYWAHAFPAVVSHASYGQPWDYTAFRGVQDFFVHAPRTDASLIAATQLQKLDRGVVFFPDDDKGYADFSRLAFAIFGVRIASIFWLYVTIFALSVGAFIVAFHDDIAALAVCAVVCLGMDAGIPAFPVSLELGQFTNPRAIGTLSLIAFAHLLWQSMRGSRRSAVFWLATAFQVAVITLVVFCRSSEVWQPAILLGVVIVVSVSRARAGRATANELALGAIVLAGLAVLGIYQRATFNPAYFNSKGQYRLVWHNIGIGLYLNPTLAKEYKLSLSDGAMFQRIAEVALPRGLYYRVFTSADTVDTVLLNPVKDFSEYERLCREFVLGVARTHPWQIASLVLFYKPRALWSTLQNAAGVPDASRSDLEVTYMSAADRDRLGAYFRLFKTFSIVTLVVLLVCSWQDIAHAWKTTALALALAWSGSAVPALLSYPAYHVIGPVLFTSASMAYGLLLVMASLGIAYVRRPVSPAAA